MAWKTSKEFREEVAATYDAFKARAISPEAARVRAALLKVWSKNAETELNHARWTSRLDGEELPAIDYGEVPRRIRR